MIKSGFRGVDTRRLLLVGMGEEAGAKLAARGHRHQRISCHVQA